MPVDPNDPDFKRSTKVISTYANRAFIQIEGSSGMARMVFGERPTHSTETNFHSAVVLTIRDVLDLADAIYATYDEAYPRPPPAAGLNTAGTSAAAVYGNPPPPAQGQKK